MAVDLSVLGLLTSKANSLSNLILVNPQKSLGYQPQFDSLPDGEVDLETVKSFLFHYEGENTVSLESDITDHYTEDNKSLQDQIALRPETITVTGYIGELTNIINGDDGFIKTVEDKLQLLGPFVPVVSSTAALAANTARSVYTAAKLAKRAGVSAWKTVTGGEKEPVQNNQQKAFQEFYGYWQNRQLFTVQTPWAILQDMAIKSLRAIQDEDTSMITTFEISFKRMRFAKTGQLLSAANSQSRLSAQSYPVIDHGTSTPVPDVGIGSKINTTGLA